ncbi:hypothetical protein PUN28_006614 [Cardiocondyla obscurior]|uniref:Uncharacterized protein n=1 Tax=Cardiocondyla obscurior TaxID=286306 RepID=A0AAW2GB51_9HYME
MSSYAIRVRSPGYTPRFGMPSSVVTCCETKPTRSSSREGHEEALRYYWNSFALTCSHAGYVFVVAWLRRARVTCLLCVSKRISYEPENAGESCDERFPPFRNRSNLRGPELAFPRVPGFTAFARLPGVDLPRRMDGVVRDAILEPLRVGTRTATWKVTYLAVNKDVCSVPYPTAPEIATLYLGTEEKLYARRV